MSMIAEALKYLDDRFYRPVQPLAIGGSTYLDRRLELPPAEPAISAFKLSTLQGVLDAAAFAALRDKNPVSIVVSSPGEVDAWGEPVGRHKVRDHYASARFPSLELDKWREVEDFLIFLAANFQESPDLLNLIAVLSSVSDEMAVRTADDGVSQSVAVQKGVVVRSREVLPRLVELAPFRTFREVEPPASKFLFRLKKDPTAGPVARLFEAQGGAWKVQAVANVRAWFVSAVVEGNLENISVLA